MIRWRFAKNYRFQFEEIACFCGRGTLLRPPHMGCCPKDHLACVHLFQVNFIISDPTLIHHIDLTSKTDFTRLCCSSIAGRDPTYLKMKSPALLNLSRIVTSTQSDEGVWRLYTLSRVLNTYCIEKTLRLRIFWPCPLTLSTEVKSKLNFKIARKYFVRSEHFLQLLIDFAWVRGSSCVNDWLWFNSRQWCITEWIIQVGVV